MGEKRGQDFRLVREGLFRLCYVRCKKVRQGKSFLEGRKLYMKARNRLLSWKK